MQIKLKGWIIPNCVTEDFNGKILLLDLAGRIGNGGGDRPEIE